jgi:hypothetical protein
VQRTILVALAVLAFLLLELYQSGLLTRIDARDGPLAEPIELSIKELPAVTQYATPVCCMVPSPNNPEILIPLETTVTTVCGSNGAPEELGPCYRHHVNAVEEVLEGCTPCQQ